MLISKLSSMEVTTTTLPLLPMETFLELLILTSCFSNVAFLSQFTNDNNTNPIVTNRVQARVVPSTTYVKILVPLVYIYLI